MRFIKLDIDLYYDVETDQFIDYSEAEVVLDEDYPRYATVEELEILEDLGLIEVAA